MNHSLLLKRVFALSGARRPPAHREAIWSIQHRRRWAWLALGVSCAAYVLVSLAHHQAFHLWGRLNFFDLKVYRGAARLVLDGRPVYVGPIWQWAPFTYPPFAAVLLVGYSYLPKLMTKPGFVPSHGPSVLRTLAGSPYVLIGLFASAIAGTAETRRAGAALPITRPGSRHRFAIPGIASHPKATR